MELVKAHIQKDLVVIGGGPAGYVAAIRGSQLGMKTALIERGEIGGTCLNVGCIPMKTLGKISSLYSQTKNLDDFGITVGDPQLDFEKVQKHKNRIIKQLVNGVQTLLRKNNVEIIKGNATLLTPYRIKVTTLDNESLEVLTRKVILATGTKPRSLPGLSPDGERVVTSTEALSWKELPARVAIVGGGVIGLEFADALAQMGSEVTVFELLSRILPGEDDEAVGLLQKSLARKGVRFYTRTAVEGVKHQENGTRINFRVETGDIRQKTVDKVLVAVGRIGNFEGLGLEKAGIKLDKGQVSVDSKMYTGHAGIYAAGDIVPGWQLAHVAFAEGIVAAENAAGKVSTMEYDAVPRCVYTHPELATVGMTEAQARELHRGNVQVDKVPLIANGKALINGTSEGFIKMVTEKKYGEILGITIIGDSATELIAEGSLALKLEAVIEEVAKTIHPHPSISEIMKEVALLALRYPIHTI